MNENKENKKKIVAWLLVIVLVVLSTASTVYTYADNKEGETKTGELNMKLTDLWDKMVASIEEFFGVWETTDQATREEFEKQNGDVSAFLFGSLNSMNPSLTPEEMEELNGPAAPGPTRPVGETAKQEETEPEKTKPETVSGQYVGAALRSARSSTSLSAARAAKAQVLSGSQSGDGITISADTILQDFSYTANTGKDAIRILDGKKVTLTIKGNVTLKGGDGEEMTAGGAGILVPEKATLQIKGDGKLTAIGGSAGQASDGLPGEKNSVHTPYSGHGAGGAGAGIGGRGGNGGEGLTNSKSNGRDGEATSTGSVFLLERVNVNAQGGSSTAPAGSGGKGSLGMPGWTFVGVSNYSIMGGTGGSGGGGSGFNAAGIGGGGVGGGGGGSGHYGGSCASAPMVDSSASGGGGGGGGAGFVGGGGGGGGGCAKFTNSFFISHGTNSYGGYGGGPGENGLTGENMASGKIFGGNGGRAGEQAFGGAGGAGGALPVTGDSFSDFGNDGTHGGKAGEYSSAGMFFAGSHVTVNAKSGGDGADNVGNGGSPVYHEREGSLPAYELDLADVKLDQTEFDYDGLQKKPKPNLKFNGNEVTSGYTVTYENNIHAGTAKAIIRGNECITNQEPFVTGTKTVNFKINKVYRESSLNVPQASIAYKDSITANINENKDNADVKFTVESTESTRGEAALEPVANGVVTLTGNYVGKVKLTAKLPETTDFYADELTQTIAIVPKTIANCYSEPIPQQIYTGQPLTPEVKLSDGNYALTSPEDYTAEYKTNTKIGQATVVITGAGNYTGSKTLTFAINNASIESAKAAAIADVTYNGSEHTPKPVLTFQGNTLTENTDYILTYTHNVNVGEAEIRIDGIGDYSGFRTEKFRILPQNINSAAIAAFPSVTFSGEVFRPKPSVSFNGRNLEEGKDFTTVYGTNTEAGKAAVTITGQGNYIGSKSADFDINKRMLTVIPAAGQSKIATKAEPLDLGTNYTYENHISGYIPEFTGKLSREAGEDVGPYKITKGNLALTSKAVNKNYDWELKEEYFNVLSPAEISVTPVLNGTKGDNGWYISPVELSVNEGYKLSKSNSAAASNIWSAKITFPDGNYEKSGALYYATNDGFISNPKSIQFKQDTVPPTGNIVVKNNTWNKLLNKVTFGYFFKDTVEVKIYGTDYTSGVGAISYLKSSKEMTLDQLKASGAWVEGDSFSSTDEKMIVYAKIKDKAGNAAYLGTDGIIYDKNAPVIESSYSYDNKWTALADPQITVNIKDPVSGLKDRSVTWNRDGAAKQVIEPGADGTVKNYKIKNLPDGDYMVRINAKDKAGNEALEKTIHVKKDASPPMVKADTSKDWKKDTIKLAVDAQDPESGITSYRYSLDGGKNFSSKTAWENDKDIDITIDKDGIYDNIIVEVENASGLTARTKAGDISAYLDCKAPAVSLKVTDFGKSDITGERWYGSELPVLSFDIPYESGKEAPVHVYHKIFRTGTKAPDDYEKDGAPVLKSDGTYTVQYYAEDEAGNRSAVKEEQIRTDLTAPSFDSEPFTFAMENGESFDLSGNFLDYGNFFKNPVKITVNANDSGSGMGRMYYTLNGGNKVQFPADTKTFLIPNGTSGRIIVYAEDKAGNMTSQLLVKNTLSEVWNVEDKAPVIGEVMADKEPNDSGWYHTGISLTSDILDEDSGLKNVSGYLGSEGDFDLALSGTENEYFYRYEGSVDEEGTAVPINISAADNGGNSSNLEKTYKIDKTAPRITMEKEETKKAEKSKIKVTASDSLSGIKSIRYSIDRGVTWLDHKDFTQEDKTVTFTITLEDGHYGKGDMIQVEAFDMADNKENANNGSFDISFIQDTTAPPQPVAVVKPGTGGSLNEAAGWYIGELPPVIDLTVPEDHTAEASLVKGYWRMYPSSEDAPETYYHIGLYSEKTEGDNVVTKEDKPEITKEGEYYLEYYSIDDAGNYAVDKDGNKITEEHPVRTVIRWDNSAPVFDTPSYTLTKEDNSPLEDLGNILSFGNFYKEKIKITTGVSDKFSGLVKLTCSVNGEEQDIDISKKPYTFTLPLDTKGKIYLKATDKSGLSTQVQIMGRADSGDWILEDGTPVIGEIKASTAPNRNGWYAHDPLIFSEISDWDSGLKEVKYKLNEEEEVTVPLNGAMNTRYDFSQILEGEGDDIKVSLKAADNAGSESESEKSFKIDKTEPEVTGLSVKAPEGYTPGTWTKEQVEIEAQVSDSLSGVAFVSYSVDSGKTWIDKDYDTPADKQTITFPLKDGRYPADGGKILVRVKDFAGNENEATLKQDIRQDTKKAPEALPEIKPGGTYDKDTKWYAGKAPVISLTVAEASEDETVNHTYWKLWNASSASEPSEYTKDGTPEITDGNGKYHLKYYTEDAIGNRSDEKETELWWDNTVPDYKDPAFTYQSEGGGALEKLGNFFTFGNYFKEGVRVTAHVTDAMSGMKSLKYSINGGAETEITIESGGTGSFLIPKGTAGEVSLELTDVAGNRTAKSVLGSTDGQTWVTEDAGPVIGDMAADKEASADGWYNEDMLLSSVITDEESGVCKVTCTMGSLEEKTLIVTDSSSSKNTKVYTWKDTLKEEGIQNIHVTAIDNSDNSSDRTFTFKLDKTKPSGVKLKTVEGKAFYNKDIELELSAQDKGTDGAAVSGVKKFAYSLNSGKTWTEKSYDPSDSTKNRFTITKDGTYENGKTEEILLKVWDKADNCLETTAEESGLKSISKDTVIPPKAKLTVTPSADGGHRKEWYRGSEAPDITLMVAEATEDETPNHVYWTLYEESKTEPAIEDWNKDGKPALPKEGKYILKYYTEDEAGNNRDKDAPKEVKINYDKTPPVYGNGSDMRTAFVFEKTGTDILSKIGNFITAGNYFKEGVEVTVKTQDGLSGVEALSYTLNDNAAVSVPIDGEKPGSFLIPLGTSGQITVYAMDTAGNMAQTAVIGSDGNDFWSLEDSAPVIGDFAAKAEKNKAGWYKTEVPIEVEVTDNDSGVSIVESNFNNASKKDVVQKKEDDKIKKTYTFTDTLKGEGKEVSAVVGAVDNAMNSSTKTQVYAIDMTKPVISDVKGWPKEHTVSQPVLTFKVTDENSGVDPDSIEVIKDGKRKLSVDVEKQEDESYLATVTLDGNGDYEIHAEDIADNAAEIWKGSTNKIDTSKPDEAQVLINPDGPDGQNGWYLTTPDITIIAPEQKGVLPLHTYYTIYEEGTEEPPKEEAAEFLSDQESTWPKLPKDGVWQLHVWVENSMGVKSPGETRKTLMVDTTPPQKLKIQGVPNKPVNTDVTLTAMAVPAGTALESFCYSLDNGSTYSGWLEWKDQEDNIFKIVTDISEDKQVRIKVRDKAGNTAETESVTVIRDTVPPIITMDSPEAGEKNIGGFPVFRFSSNEPVQKAKNGSIDIYNAATGDIWCQLPVSSKFVKVDGQKITAELPYSLEENTAYYVRWSNGVVRDAAGNTNLTAGGSADWQFSTGAVVSAARIEGYNINVYSGTPENNSFRELAAAPFNNTGTVFSAIVKPGFKKDGEKLARLKVAPIYNREPKKLTVTSEQKGVRIRVEKDHTFTVDMPASLKEAELVVTADQAASSRLRLAIIGSSFRADASGELNPKVEEQQVLNSLNLYQDAVNTEVKNIHIALNVVGRKGDSRAAVTGDTRLEELLGVYLPREEIKTQLLSLTLTKEAENEDGTRKSDELTVLDNPIEIAMDIPSECRGYQYYTIARIHDGEVSMLPLELNGSKTRGSFRSDRFSDYAVIATNDPVVDTTVPVKYIPGSQNSRTNSGQQNSISRTGLGNTGLFSIDADQIPLGAAPDYPGSSPILSMLIKYWNIWLILAIGIAAIIMACILEHRRIKKKLIREMEMEETRWPEDE